MLINGVIIKDENINAFIKRLTNFSIELFISAIIKFILFKLELI